MRHWLRISHPSQESVATKSGLCWTKDQIEASVDIMTHVKPLPHNPAGLQITALRLSQVIAHKKPRQAIRARPETSTRGLINQPLSPCRHCRRGHGNWASVRTRRAIMK